MKIGILTPNKKFFGSQIVMIPFFYNLTNIFPDAHITVISPRKEISMLSDLGFIDEIIINDLSCGFKSFFHLVENIKKQKFDILFTLRRKSERDWLINLLSGGKFKIGFKRKWSPLVYNYCFSYDKETYRGANFLKLLEPFKNYEKYGDGSDTSQKRSIRTVPILFPEYNCKTSPSVWLIPCGSRKEKLWPINNYIELAEKIILKLNKKVVFVLGNMEKKYKSDIINKLQKYGSSIEFLIEQPVKVLLGESNNCIAAVSNDCGPSHIPQITGHTSFILFPYGTNVYEWVNREGRSVEIVSEKGPVNCISVSDVFREIEQKINNES